MHHGSFAEGLGKKFVLLGKAAEAWLRFGFWEGVVFVVVLTSMRSLDAVRREWRMCVVVAGSMVGWGGGEAASASRAA